MNYSRTWVVAAALIALMTTRCSKSSESPAVAQDAGAGTLISAAQGGTVKSDDGLVALTIEPGSLPADTYVSIEAARPDEVPARLAALKLIGAVYRLQPAGLTMTPPATLELTLQGIRPPKQPGESIPAGALHLYDGVERFDALGEHWGTEEQTQHMVLDYDADSVSVVGTVSHFSWLVTTYGGVDHVLTEVPSPVGFQTTFQAEAWIRNGATSSDVSYQLLRISPRALDTVSTTDPDQNPDVTLEPVAGNGHWSDPMQYTCAREGRGKYGYFATILPLLPEGVSPQLTFQQGHDGPVYAHEGIVMYKDPKYNRWQVSSALYGSVDCAYSCACCRPDYSCEMVVLGEASCDGVCHPVRSCGEVNCHPTGACCYNYIPECANNVHSDNCAITSSHDFYPGKTCDDPAVACTPGACCQLATGTCTNDVLKGQCEVIGGGGAVTHHVGQACAQIDCPKPGSCMSDPLLQSGLATATNLNFTDAEFCGMETAVAILEIIHSSANVEPKPVAGDHTTLRRYAAGLRTYSATDVAQKFNDSNFPCGSGPNGITLCPSPTTDVPAGDFFVLFGVVQQPIAASDTVNLYQYGFVFDSDADTSNNYQASASYPNDFFQDTDRWYEANYAPSPGWTMKVTDAKNGIVKSFASSARIIVSGNAIVLVVPVSEFASAAPLFRLTAFRHTGDYGMQPPYNWDGSLWPAVADGLQSVLW